MYVGMFQETRSISWEVAVSIILRKKMYMNMCPIPNCFARQSYWIE